MTLPYAPPPRPRDPPPVVTPPGPLNQVSRTAQQRQAQVPGEGAPLRIVLGMDQIGAQIGPCWSYNGKWYFRCIWALGECEGVQSLTTNDQPLPAGARVTHYNGATTQGVDPWLAAAAAHQSPPVSYTDTLVFTVGGAQFGICYSVVEVPASEVTSMPTFKAVLKGLKLFDPRSGLRVWSDNAGLGLRALLTEPWGEGKTITGGDTALADRCDDLLGSGVNQEKRCRLGITLGTRQIADNWRVTLATLAEAFVVPDGDGYLLIPDAPADSEYIFDTNASMLQGNVLELGQIKRAGTKNLPTVITGWYTDRSSEPYRDLPIEPVKRPGVDAGLVQVIPQEIRLDGVFSPGQMRRICTTRLNRMHLCDLSGTLHALDDSVQVRPGTVITLSDERGLTEKQLRIMDQAGVGGRMVMSFVEHDNSAYCETVVANPSTPDTRYPLPTDPPVVTGLAVTESFVPNYNGRGVTRFFASWLDASFPFLDGYRVELRAGSQLMDSARVDGTTYASPPLTEGVTYTIEVATLSKIAASAPVGVSRMAQGKLLPPGDVPYFNGYELGGVVYFFWQPGADLDRTGHEIRRASIDGGETVAQHWARAAVVDRIADPGVTKESTNEPEGTWRYMIKCLDSVRSVAHPFGQESLNAAWKDITITSDARAFWSGVHTFETHTLTGMIEYDSWPPLRDKYISSAGTSFATLFPDPLSTYTEPLATYDAPTSSEFLTGPHDFGAMVSGQWFIDVETADCYITDLSGTHTVYLRLSPNGTDWTEYEGTSVVASGRFVAVRIESNGVMCQTGRPTVRVQVRPKTEAHSVVTSASGPVSLTLDRAYVASFGEPKATPTGSSPIFSSCDNLVIDPDTGETTLDVYAWNQSGALISATVGVEFNGILRT